MKTLPLELKYGYLGNPSHETRVLVFGDDFHPTVPNNPTTTPTEVKRRAMLEHIADLRSIYSAATVSYEPFCLGIRDAMMYFENTLSALSLESCLLICSKTYEIRLCPPIERIKAAFLSHNPLSAGRLLDQDKEEINQVEAYVYGCREGLHYALVLAKALLESGDNSTSMKCLAAELTKRFHQPSFGQIDLIWQGADRADKFIRDCTHQDNSDALDPTRYEELLSERANFIFFIETMRANPTMFYIFKLGFGFVDLHPKKSNRVFDLTVPAEDVPTADVIELIDLHARASSRPSPITWVR